MAKYRKRAVVIEAEQWYPNKHVCGVEFPSKRVDCVSCGFIETLEGGHIVSSGDWIITGVKGEKYPCKPDIFEITYEVVESPSKEKGYPS